MTTHSSRHSRARHALPPPEGRGAICASASVEEMLRAALEAAPAGMVVLEESGTIALVNSRVESIFGYRREELIGATIDILLQRRFRDKHRAHRTGYFAAPQVRVMAAGSPIYALRKSGKEIAVEIALHPLTTDAGRFVLASIVDVTQRVALEKRLAHSETLADIGSMISVVAHEIRNPLATIVMAARAAAYADITREEHDQVLEVLTVETNRLTRTLTDLLHFAKPCEPILKRGSLNAAVREVLNSVKADPIAAGKIEIVEAFDANLPEIPFDADQMHQVLWNLVCNAIQALGGAGRVEVSTEARLADVVVSVKDDGPGIPAENRERIFLPFFTTKTQGTGLGLAASRRIVRAHGGDIQVKSGPGRGSRFSVVLPLLAESSG
ncbi:MAG: nitrogen regulation protein NR(II) [Elusimicrobiota bacterium]